MFLDFISPPAGMISLNISGFLKKEPGRLIHLVKHSIKEIKEKGGRGVLDEVLNEEALP